MVTGSGDTRQVRVPSWRPDIEGKADLVEEVGRIYGYDRIPNVSLVRDGAVSKPALTPPCQAPLPTLRTA